MPGSRSRGLVSPHCREPQRPGLAPGGSPSGEPRQQAGLTEVSSASAQGCKSLCAPRWRRAEQREGGGTLSRDLEAAASQHSGEGLPVKAVSPVLCHTVVQSSLSLPSRLELLATKKESGAAASALLGCRLTALSIPGSCLS